MTNEPLTLTGGNTRDFCATAEIPRDPMIKEAHSRVRRNDVHLHDHVLNVTGQDRREDFELKPAHKPALRQMRAINLETGPTKGIMPTSNCFAVKTTRKPARKKLVRWKKKTWFVTMTAIPHSCQTEEAHAAWKRITIGMADGQLSAI